MPAEERQLSNIMNDLPSITIDNAELLARDKDTGTISKVDGKISNLTLTATEADLVAGNHLVVDTPYGTKRLPAGMVAKASDVDDLIKGSGVKDITQDVTWTTGKYLYSTPGRSEFGNLYSESRAKVTNYIPCEGVKKIAFNLGSFNRTGVGFVFFGAQSASSAIYGEEHKTATNSVTDYVVNVPEGAKYFRTNFLSDSISEGFPAFYCKLTTPTLNSLDEKIDSVNSDLSSQISSTNENVATLQKQVDDFSSLNEYETSDTFTTTINVQEGDKISLRFLDATNWVRPSSGYACQLTTYLGTTAVTNVIIKQNPAEVPQNTIYFIPSGVNKVSLTIKVGVGGNVKFRWGSFFTQT